jgi:hypothetical protein
MGWSSASAKTHTNDSRGRAENPSPLLPPHETPWRVAQSLAVDPEAPKHATTAVADHPGAFNATAVDPTR